MSGGALLSCGVGSSAPDQEKADVGLAWTGALAGTLVLVVVVGCVGASSVMVCCMPSAVARISDALLERHPERIDPLIRRWIQGAREYAKV